MIFEEILEEDLRVKLCGRYNTQVPLNSVVRSSTPTPKGSNPHHPQPRRNRPVLKGPPKLPNDYPALKGPTDPQRLSPSPVFRWCVLSETYDLGYVNYYFGLFWARFLSLSLVCVVWNLWFGMDGLQFLTFLSWISEPFIGVCCLKLMIWDV